MRKYLCITILLAIACLSSGCTQKVKINLIKPGEIKISGLSKIAVLPFNSVKPNIAAGKYCATQRVCDLTRRCVTDTLYTEPYFQLVDLDIEETLTQINKGARPENRLDGILYGQVWWQVSDEYKNFSPCKMNLRKWRTVKYVCGTNDDGSVRYCTTTITTQDKDEFYKAHYRAVTATLMMSLNLYRLTPNGQVEKVAQIFEVGRKPAVIYNGAYSTELKLIGFEEAKDRTATLKTSDGFTFAALSEMLGVSAKSDEKSTLDTEVSQNNDSIPAALNLKNSLAQAVANRLKMVIQPHSEPFDIVMHGKDKKSQTMFMTQAYRGLTKYLALKIADNNGDLADTLLEDLVFEDVAKEALLRKLKAEHEAKQAELPAEQRQPFVAPEEAELTKDAKSYLDGMTSDIYNMALALEGLGDFDRSLEIYRYAFNEYENTDQDIADGIGRCSLALDMAVRVDEAVGAKEDAKNNTRLKK
ncbi:hypothetical protein [Maridesulfovibrio sp. FT414]|uniref:hypothetical protein n=1 Tax=Maridesulfovibrio sp. FT414 TaxID=2979469 RepID=UPI003D801854